MKDLKPTIPGLKDIYDFYTDRTNPYQPSKFDTLGDVLSGLLVILFYVAIFIAFYFLVWAAISYVLAQGQKEQLAKARARITWTLVGLMVIIMAYFIAGYVREILPQGPNRGWLPF